MKHVVYIHGASSTKRSFNFLRLNLCPSTDYSESFFEYDSSEDLEALIHRLLKFIPDGFEEIILIGHSLGGILATGVTYNNESLSTKKNIRKVITISSPLGGSKAATYLRWLYPHYGLFDNVATNNPVIMAIQGIGAIVPTLNIISSGGTTPLIKEANDGVVSTASQSSLKHVKETLIVPLNHFEVLLAPEVTDKIVEFIWP